MNKLLSFFFLLGSAAVYAQQQNIRGTVTDQISGQPLAGVQVSFEAYAVTTDSLGYFLLAGLPVGRVSITCRAGGYEVYRSEELLLNSRKEIFLEVTLKPNGIILNEVKVSGKYSLDAEPVNPTAFVSVRSFTPEETERIPAAMSDPARMALSLSGIQSGRYDDENQLIIRGNSPMGLLWRIEGVDIPSPNHFTKHGSSAGGVTLFSTAVIAKSDFFTGGMPAEYGNALSGVFDIRLRKGNDQKNTNSFKAGLLGIDLSTEGPIKKGRSSYLINYRYSTFGLINRMKLYLSDERSLKTFEDLSFNLVFYSKDHKTRTNIFGVGGFSTEHEYPVKDPAKRDPGIQDEWEDLDRDNRVGIAGVSVQRTMNHRSSLKAGLALVGSQIKITEDTLDLKDVRFRYENEIYLDKRISGSLHYVNQLSKRTFFKSGFIINYLNFKFFKELYPRYLLNDPAKKDDARRLFADGDGTTHYTQAYALVMHDLTPRLRLNAGFHLLRHGLNRETSLEPRLSAKYWLNSTHQFSMAAGLYSQLIPMSTYFVTQKVVDDDRVSYHYPNKNLNFPRTFHLVLGHTLRMRENWKLVSELYYQNITRVTIQPLKDSNFWFLNYASGWPDVEVVAQGEGENYGLDVALEKRFSNRYYLLLNGSVYDALFTTLDKIPYKSAFSDGYSSALTFGKEFKVGTGSLHAGARVLYNGGFRYSPADVEKTMQLRFYYPVIAQTNALRSPAYFRIDTRISYRINLKKLASVVSLDIQNLTNRQNYTRAVFNYSKKEVELQRRSGGLVPLASIQVDF